VWLCGAGALARERSLRSGPPSLLQPDVAEAFPTEDAVNEALRGILSTTRAVRRIGGLPDRSLQPGRAKSKPIRRAT